MRKYIARINKDDRSNITFQITSAASLRGVAVDFIVRLRQPTEYVKMKKKSADRDVDECHEKILAVLKEYNCKIDFDTDLGNDGDLGVIVVVDVDSMDYVEIGVGGAQIL